MVLSLEVEFLSFSSHTMVQNIILSPFHHPFVCSFQTPPSIPLASSRECNEETRSPLSPPLLIFFPFLWREEWIIPSSAQVESATIQVTMFPPQLSPPLLIFSPLPSWGECTLLLLLLAATSPGSTTINHSPHCTNAQTLPLHKCWNHTSPQSTKHWTLQPTYHTPYNTQFKVYNVQTVQNPEHLKYFREILCQEGLRTHDDDV